MATPKQMRPAQAETVRRILASDDGLLRPFPGGHWTIVHGGRREAAWSAHIVTVRAMQAHGWLERTKLRSEPWLDPRRLTEAGKAELARIDHAPPRATGDGRSRLASAVRFPDVAATDDRGLPSDAVAGDPKAEVTAPTRAMP
jgi:hypothetical protein